MNVSSLKTVALSALFMQLTVCAAFAGSEVRVDRSVWHSQRERAEELKKVNADRIKAMKGEGDVVHFAVPALSELMRLEDTWPEDGQFNGTVKTVLAKGEFESCSFQLFSFKNLENVDLDVDLKLENDLRVVKLWFQNGNGWVSYFEDVGLKLTPELLLHDENLIKVVKDDEPANYARVRKDGKDKFVWISAPRTAESGAGSFNQYDEGFVDADKLQPVKLEKNSFKQFILTIKAAKDQKPGVYKGVVKVTRKGKLLHSIPLAVKVLPFELPLPKGYLNPKVPYLHTCMGTMPWMDRITPHFGGNKEKALKYYRNHLQSLYDHSVFHAPYFNGSNEWCIPMLKEIGFPLDVVMGSPLVPWYALNFGGRMSWQNVMDAKKGAKRCHEYYSKHFPGATVLCPHGDEQGTAFVTAHREMFREYEKYGIHLGCAGHGALLYKGGYAYSFQPIGGRPDNMYEATRPWREIGADYLGFYACQHTGSENPQFTRRQHGLLGWLNGATMSYNYEFAIGTFNDLYAVLYRPMVVTYANSQGLMETIQYAGFREACDDIRYGTYLKQLADECLEKGDVDARITAKKSLMYLAMLNRDSVDLNLARLEMIRHIMEMRKALGK